MRNVSAFLDFVMDAHPREVSINDSVLRLVVWTYRAPGGGASVAVGVGLPGDSVSVGVAGSTDGVSVSTVAAASVSSAYAV